MSRHHHRFERDYRGPWERRDVRPTGLHNGGANHSCASAVVNGNNRPGLLPLPVIPSLLPTPVTVAVTTSSGDIAVKRGITAAGSVASASAKVRTPLARRTGGNSLLSLRFCGNRQTRTRPNETSALRSLSHRPSASSPGLQRLSGPVPGPGPGTAVLMAQLSGLVHVSLCCLLHFHHFPSVSIFSL